MGNSKFIPAKVCRAVVMKDNIQMKLMKALLSSLWKVIMFHLSKIPRLLQEQMKIVFLNCCVLLLHIIDSRACGKLSSILLFLLILNDESKHIYMYRYTYTYIYKQTYVRAPPWRFLWWVTREIIPAYSKKDCLYTPLCRKHSLDVK